MVQGLGFRVLGFRAGKTMESPTFAFRGQVI